MKIGFIASVLAVTLITGAAGSAFAARPGPRMERRDAFRAVVEELTAINMELAWVLQRPVSQRDLQEVIGLVNFLTEQVNQQESRVEFLLAQEPDPPDAEVTAALQNVLTVANAIAQEAWNELELNSSTWPAGLVDAVSNVEDASQNVVNVVQDVLGGGIPS